MTASAWQPGLQAVSSLDSTNRQVLDWARQGAPHGVALRADVQTAGRGRQGRVWHSETPTGLWMSVLVRHPTLARWMTLLPQAAGLAVCEAVDADAPTDPPPTLKWPNDVWIDGRKLAGILCEGVVEQGQVRAVVVGVGLNLLPPPTGWPAGLHAVSLGEVRAALPSVRDLGMAVRARLLDRVEALIRGERAALVEAARAREGTLGQRVAFEAGHGPATGMARDLDPDGGLVVAMDDGTLRTLRAGEVTLVRPLTPAPEGG